MDMQIPSLSGADLLVLRSLSELLIVLGSVGLVTTFLSDRPRPKRLLTVLLASMAAGGLVLAGATDELLAADRDLTPAQQAALSNAISLFSGVKFEVHTLRNDREARSLALKMVDAIRAGSGAMPQFVDGLSGLDPGVILVFAPDDVEFRRTFSNAVGTKLAAARIAVITADEAVQPKQSVRIVVGRKP
jgi:hypothetical protein